MTFDEIGLNEQLLDAIFYMGFENATPIQEQAIPKILDGKDLIACAQTGTGKTAAFILPILDKLASADRDSSVNTLVIVPTRELALQIDQQIQGFGYFAGISSIPVYGGGDGDNWEVQKSALTQGADIVVATPGKLISHLNLGYVKFDQVEHLILDEADRMLDMGFIHDIQKIITYLPKERQSLFFSATMAPKIKKFAQTILKDPHEINIATAKPAEGVLQAAYLAHDTQKVSLVTSLISGKEYLDRILVFTSTKKMVSQIVLALVKKGLEAKGISSDLDQREREAVLAQYSAGELKILVATDVLSRGIDIKNINLVINFDVPSDAADYVHRIGRTARADTTGIALTLVNEKDIYKFRKIEELIESEVYKAPLPPELGEGPEWKKSRPSGGKGGKRNYRKKKSD